MSLLTGANVFVTGCSRGLGLEMVKQLAVKNTGKIFASCRAPEQASELGELAKHGVDTKVPIEEAYL